MVSSNHLTELLITSVIILVNGPEIILILKAKKSLSLFQVLLLSLAVTDLLVGLLQFILTVLQLYDVEIKSFKLNSILYFTIAASVNHVNAITADRFIAIRWPLKHRHLVSRRRIAIYIAITWCISIVMLMPLFIRNSMEYVKYILSIVMFAYSGVMVFVYSFIIYRVVVVRGRVISIAAQQDNATQASKDVQLVVVSVVLTITFMICTVPFCVCAFITNHSPKTVKYLLLSNSLCNPCIYFFWKLLQARFKTPRPTTMQMQKGMPP
ncbi:5-hydroxytryptamine receptor 2C-like [Rhopilema esculentum]|uniref:5-hydroxytryptamine receptor 2C-like n=1 Tax=Rhopilema esculentum TaxID=499914 RepID=UPI0031D5A83A|eukprot:gene17579-9214_t